MEVNKIYLGHNLATIKKWPDECVNTIMTSPPYWGLRDYGTKKQIWGGDPSCNHEWMWGKNKKKDGGFSEKLSIKGIENYQSKPESKYAFCSECESWLGELGQEPNPDLFISHLCDLFDECKRILKIDGACWVNLGDTHAGSGGNGGQTGIHQSGSKKMANWKQGNPDVPNKCLIGIPFRFAMEMTRRGWILRNTIIWHKPSCMVSSATDRFTIDYEYVFFFVKNNKTQYYVNGQTDSIQRKKPLGIKGIENVDWFINKRGNKQTHWKSFDYYFKQQFEPLKESTLKRAQYKWCAPDSKSSKHQQINGLNRNESFEDALNPLGRNKRTVWEINTANEKEAHFAVYPEELVFIPIDSSCPPKICSKCGLPQILAVKRVIREVYKEKHKFKNNTVQGNVPFQSEIVGTKWVKCKCKEPFIKGVIFDPFMGSGTTARVACKNARDFVGCEVNAEYHKIAMDKLKPFLGKTMEDFF